MSERCSIEMCKSPSRTQCHCCKKNFCRNHFIEHDNLPDLQLNSLADEINLLNDRLTAFNVEKLIGDSRQKLEEWRIRCHQMIDGVFEAKCREIDQCANKKVDQQRDEIHQMRSTVTELLRKQETTMKDVSLLKATINTIEEKINAMEQTCFELIIQPLVIEDGLIRIDELYRPRLNLSLLPPPYKTINHTDGCSEVIGSNAQFFLINQALNLSLMNRELTAIKTSPWSHGLIWDTCWSSILTCFFIITEMNLFRVDDKTLFIESIEINQNKKWCSCTCADATLFLSTFEFGSSIFQFRLFPSIQFEKQWKSPETCAKDQVITNIVYHNKTLALTLFDVRKEEKMMELRSSTTLERLWSLKLDIEYNKSLSRCCFLNHGDWLVWDYGTLNLLHITNDGKLQATNEYIASLVNLILVDGDQLVISTTKSINIHRIKS